MTFNLRHSVALAAIACAGFGMASMAEAKTFKWANSGDVSSMDPYARQETFLLTFTQNIYDPLIRRDKNLKLEPALATKWGQTDPTTWFFDIRPGVKFHDGSPLTADDIVFSLNRANGPGSNMQSNFVSVKEIKKVGDLARRGRRPSIPTRCSPTNGRHIVMMSKAWAEKNNAVNSADMTKNEENFATRNAMGTGPFMLKERKRRREDRPGQQSQLVGQARRTTSPRSIFTPVANPATRIAALKAGDIDMTYEVPPADTETLEEGRQHQGARRPRDARRLPRHGPGAATSCSSPTSRARTRSRTSGCARPSIARSTSRRSSAR